MEKINADETGITLEIIDKCSFEQIQCIRNIFSEANSRLNSFLPEEVLAYQLDEMNITIFPIANIIIARRDREISGFIAMLDNYVIGIYTVSGCEALGIEKKLLESAKQLYPALEVNLYFKCLPMVEFYINEGFQLTDHKTNMSTSETMLTLVFNPLERQLASLLAEHDDYSMLSRISIP